MQRRSIIVSSDNKLTQLFQATHSSLFGSILSATMLSILLLSAIVLLCQFSATEANFLDYVEAQYQKAVQKRLSKFYDNVNAAYNPLVEGQQSSSSRSINVEQLTTGDTIFFFYIAPDTGRVILSLVHEETDDLILNIGVRYTFGTEKNVLVLNSRKDGIWGKEIRPSGFDFSPNIQVNLLVTAGDVGFDIYAVNDNGVPQYISAFSYRPGLPLDLVNLIRVQSDGNSAVDNVGLGVFYTKES